MEFTINGRNVKLMQVGSITNGTYTLYIDGQSFGLFCESDAVLFAYEEIVK
jgi:hypothetical protein